MAQRTGIWLVGARGAVATASTLGLAALARGLSPTTGLVTELPPLDDAGLVGWDQLVVGGHEVREGRLVASAEALVAGGVAPRDLVDQCRDDLQVADRRIRPGVLFRSGAAIDQIATRGYARPCDSPRAAIEAIQQDLEEFRAAEDLQRVVVVLVASTEPAVDLQAIPESWDALARTLDAPEACPLPSSALYAIAALDMGMPFVNFTPSLGASCPAIEELAVSRGAAHAGRDGKTGETLLKSVLAPMFASRHLEVMSWVGHNILGNADGQVLGDPANKQSKVACKDSALAGMLGYEPQSLVSIEYIQSLGDHKTAWDHVHFKGFLGAQMTMQVTWQGIDSALAAPLVLDLARLADEAARRGERGALGYLASFFKNPLGATSRGHAEQFMDLLRRFEPARAVQG